MQPRVRLRGQGQSAPYTYGDVLPEGATIEITASLGTHTKTGKLSVAPRLTARNGEHKLRLTADVRPFLAIDPPHHRLGDVPVGEVRTVSCVIRTADGKPFKPTAERIEPVTDGDPAPRVKTWLEPLHAGPDGRSTHWRATFRLGPDADLGAVGVQLKVKVGDRQRTIGVHGRVVGRFGFEQSFVPLGLMRPDAPLDREVSFHSRWGGLDMRQVRFQLRLDDSEARSADERARLQAAFAVVVLPKEQEPVPGARRDRSGAESRPGPGGSTGCGTADGPASGSDVDAVTVQLRYLGLSSPSEGLRSRQGDAPITGSVRGQLVALTGDSNQPEIELPFSGVLRVGAPLKASRGRSGARSASQKN